jgi:hypothetical protein
VRQGNPVVIAEACVDAAVAAAGAPLPPGRYDVRLSVRIASFSRDAPGRAGGVPLTITVSPAAHVSAPHRFTRVSRRLARGKRALARTARGRRRRPRIAGRG